MRRDSVLPVLAMLLGSLACGRTNEIEGGGAPVAAAGMPDGPNVFGEGGTMTGPTETGLGATGFITGGASGTESAGGAADVETEAGQGGALPTGVCAAPGARFATTVIEHAFGGGQNFNQARFPAPIFGPPEANEPSSVVSLGNGGFVVLGFDGNAIVDGPGVDFTVFENPLPTYPELATVAVSEDGASWHEFPCTAGQDDADYGDCAGVAPVQSSSANGVDPLDPAVSGGDRYDLAELGVQRARFVRITDRADLASEIFDLDAVAIVNAECP